MHTMRPVALVCFTLLVVACAKKEQAATDSSAAAAAAAAAAPPPAPAFSLADFAGKWQVNGVPLAGKDTTPTKYVLTATADTSGWVIDFPSGLKVPVQITVSGDSVLFKTQPYASQRRKNVKVSTEGSFRVQNGKLTGISTAHYINAGADSVLQLRAEGTKMP
ncbi:MAG TPA: hypothetical protein VLN49_09375 [Gemmatimonadaceae bacterium]|nr:hypothetical protein [Gemmatimonadaceae bacterium]